MNKIIISISILFITSLRGNSQSDDTVIGRSSMHIGDSGITVNYLSADQVKEYMYSVNKSDEQYLLGGYVTSIFHESVDSVKIVLSVDGEETYQVYTDGGLFYFLLKKGRSVHLKLDHPGYFPSDTLMPFPQEEVSILFLPLSPRQRLNLRGRVYAGNMPLEGVNVIIEHNGETHHLLTKGCYYDKEDYWNCLYSGMFRFDLIASGAEDSIYINLSKSGMKPLRKGMTFSDYPGDAMDLKMRYDSHLPAIPFNNFNLKIGFPFMSVNQDWFVSLSAYRLAGENFFRRIAYGIEADMYITAVSVSHPAFDGLEPATADSAYINVFTGPSLLFWFIAPENRFFSTYAGITCAYNLSKPEIVFQPFAGTRLILDLNRAINLEMRYSRFHADIVNYTFNPYGNASRSKTEIIFKKIHFDLGFQIVF